MSGVTAAAGIALITAILTLVLKKEVPAVAFLMSLAAGLVILHSALQVLSGLISTLRTLLSVAQIDGSLYLPVLQAVGIAVVVHVTGELCRDAGQSGLAAKLETMGALAAMAVCLPLFAKVLTLVSSMLGYS